MNNPTVRTLIIHTHARDATHAIGAQIGGMVAGGQVLALCGDLGAGKTTLVQGIAAGMGISTRVTSPTFVLVNEYAANGRKLVHIDAYRLAEGTTLADAAILGLADILDEADMDGRNVIAVEWADRIRALFPADLLQIEITAAADEPDGRTLLITATGAQSSAVLAQLSALHACPPGECAS